MPAATSTLQTIREKVRRITQSPSESQLTNDQLDQYINTVILYDLPENIRIFPLRTLLTFYTQPNIDTYETTTTNVNDPLYNFKNKYIAVHPPVYIAGVQVTYLQYRDVFYGYYPQTNTVADTLLRGNGTPGVYTGRVVARPMLQRNVLFSALGANNTSFMLTDTPINNTIGNLSEPNSPPTSTIVQDPNNFINYLTGQFALTFTGNITALSPIYVENIAYQPGKPICILYYDNTFTIRPVPDKAYPVQLEVDIRPTELLNSADVPELSQWWQYIAFLASKKIFEDRMETDMIQMITPMLKEQEMLVQRATLTQYANQRTVTIYTQGKSYNWGGWFNSGWPY